MNKEGLIGQLIILMMVLAAVTVISVYFSEYLFFNTKTTGSTIAEDKTKNDSENSNEEIIVVGEPDESEQGLVNKINKTDELILPLNSSKENQSFNQTGGTK